MTIKTRIILFTSLLTFMLIGPVAVAAKVYKWVDKEGNVHYGAQKPEGSGGAQEMRIKVKEPAFEEPVQADTKAKKGGSESKEEKVKVSSQKEKEEIEKKNAEIRKKNCSIAKKRMASINAGGRLYEVDEKGERKFWDDTTKKAKQAEAQSMINEWCK